VGRCNAFSMIGIAESGKSGGPTLSRRSRQEIVLEPSHLTSFNVQ
jgi:hypothetical protein